MKGLPTLFQRKARIPFGVRLIVYSYLDKIELTIKVATLCKFDRKELPRSNIACPNKTWTIDLNEICLKLENPVSDYFYGLMTDIVIQADFYDLLHIQ